MAKHRRGRRVFYAEFDGFDEYVDKINKLDGNLKNIVSDVLEQAADDPTADTVNAMKKNYLPAKGKYSQGKTEETIIRNPRVAWTGTVGTIGIGFDKTKKGAGTLLITGTPRMKPNAKLAKIYGSVKTNRKFFNAVSEGLQNAIKELEGD